MVCSSHHHQLHHIAGCAQSQIINKTADAMQNHAEFAWPTYLGQHQACKFTLNLHGPHIWHNTEVTKLVVSGAPTTDPTCMQQSCNSPTPVPPTPVGERDRRERLPMASSSIVALLSLSLSSPLLSSQRESRSAPSSPRGHARTHCGRSSIAISGPG